MRHEGERIAERLAPNRAAQADAGRLRRRPFRSKGVAGDDPDPGRLHLSHEGGPGPGRRQFQPEIEAQRIGTPQACRQDLGRESLPRRRLRPDEAEQRIKGKKVFLFPVLPGITWNFKF